MRYHVHMIATAAVLVTLLAAQAPRARVVFRNLRGRGTNAALQVEPTIIEVAGMGPPGTKAGESVVMLRCPAPEGLEADAGSLGGALSGVAAPDAPVVVRLAQSIVAFPVSGTPATVATDEGLLALVEHEPWTWVLTFDGATWRWMGPGR